MLGTAVSLIKGTLWGKYKLWVILAGCVTLLTAGFYAGHRWQAGEIAKKEAQVQRLTDQIDQAVAVNGANMNVIHQLSKQKAAMSKLGDDRVEACKKQLTKLQSINQLKSKKGGTDVKGNSGDDISSELNGMWNE